MERRIDPKCKSSKSEPMFVGRYRQVEQPQTHKASSFCFREASAQALHPTWSLCFETEGHLEHLEENPESSQDRNLAQSRWKQLGCVMGEGEDWRGPTDPLYVQTRQAKRMDSDLLCLA